MSLSSNFTKKHPLYSLYSSLCISPYTLTLDLISSFRATIIDNNPLAKICVNEAKQIGLETLEKITDSLKCSISYILYKIEKNDKKVEQ